MRNAKKRSSDCQEPVSVSRKEAQPIDVASEDVSTRTQILSSAARLFRTQGYAAVSLRDIAKGAGLTTGSVYHNFASKEEIVSEILDQGHRRVLIEVSRNIKALGDGADARSVLRTAIHTHVSCLLGEDSFPSANIRIFSHVPVEVRMASLGARQEYEAYWLGILARCQQSDGETRDVDLTYLSNILFGAMNWTIEWFRPGRHDYGDFVDSLAILVMPETNTKPKRAPRPSKSRIG